MLHKLFKIENRNGVVGLNRRGLSLIYPHNHPRDYHLADDKVKTKTVLHDNNIACAETYAIITRISDIPNAWELCKSKNTMAIKPANGCGGGGIMILKKDDKGHWVSSGNRIKDDDILQHMTNIVSGLYSMNSDDSCLVEECIVPHPFFAEIYHEGVPDFRVITLNAQPVMAMLRMPTSKSGGKANLHQKGVGIGVDIIRGTLTQVYDGKRYLDHHPDNPISIADKPIPYWEELKQLSIDTANAFPLKYLGIDLVIDALKGPQIMEVNVRPGLGIQLVNKCGLDKAIEQFYNPNL
ncbi:MAG: sugar-transfer associated ATP-grasp domain-containing protein [Bacteroidota bacterium]